MLFSSTVQQAKVTVPDFIDAEKTCPTVKVPVLIKSALIYTLPLSGFLTIAPVVELPVTLRNSAYSFESTASLHQAAINSGMPGFV
jgi:hypothetical protein